jgi:YfiH family protein
MDVVGEVRLPDPFAWDGNAIAIALGGAQVRFTTRRGGVSGGPYASLNLGPWTEDDPAAVRENHARVAVATGCELAYGEQVHGIDVVVTDGAHAVPPRADGQATSTPGVACMVLAADCLPVAIAAPGAVAMVHAGWRGLAGGVLEQGVAAVRALAGPDAPLAAAIGPGAGGCCYETGEEVHEAVGEPGARVGVRNLDLGLAAARRLAAAGVTEVHDCGLCTMCADPALLFSHRRDGGVTGRQAGLAWLG